MNENTTTNSSDEVVVHATEDRWEADIFRTALLNADIRCKMQSEKNRLSALALALGLAALLSARFKLPMYVGLPLAFSAVIMAFIARKRGGSKKVIELVVDESDHVAAMEVVSRVSLASIELDLKREGSEGRLGVKKDGSKSRQTDDNIEEQKPTAVPVAIHSPAECMHNFRRLGGCIIVDAFEEELIAKRPGIGEVMHHVGHGYELRAGPEPYYMVDEDRWDEFQNFSAQRQEFAFLLRNEYENLYKWLKEEKQMPEFVRLIESTYRDIPPPRLKKKRVEVFGRS